MPIEDDPRIWRLRAEEARTTGDNMSDPIARLMMEEVAASYEKLAEYAERRSAYSNGATAAPLAPKIG